MRLILPISPVPIVRLPDPMTDFAPDCSRNFLEAPASRSGRQIPSAIQRPLPLSKPAKAGFVTADPHFNGGRPVDPRFNGSVRILTHAALALSLITPTSAQPGPGRDWPQLCRDAGRTARSVT